MDTIFDIVHQLGDADDSQRKREASLDLFATEKKTRKLKLNPEVKEMLAAGGSRKAVLVWSFGSAQCGKTYMMNQLAGQKCFQQQGTGVKISRPKIHLQETSELTYYVDCGRGDFVDHRSQELIWSIAYLFSKVVLVSIGQADLSDYFQRLSYLRFINKRLKFRADNDENAFETCLSAPEFIVVLKDCTAAFMSEPIEVKEKIVRQLLKNEQNTERYEQTILTSALRQAEYYECLASEFRIDFDGKAEGLSPNMQECFKNIKRTIQNSSSPRRIEGVEISCQLLAQLLDQAVQMLSSDAVLPIAQL